MINNANKLIVNKIIRFFFVSFLAVVMLNQIGCVAGPEAVKARIGLNTSDAELFSRTQQEEFKQLIKDIQQAERERLSRLDQLHKDNSPIAKQQEEIEKDNQLTPEQKKAEWNRLEKQLIKNFDNYKEELLPRHQQIMRSVGKFGSLRSYFAESSYLTDNNIEINQKYNSYRERNFSLSESYTQYYTEKGYVVFGENNQPDPRFVVDSIDKLHASNNIKTTVQAVLDQFGSEEGAGKNRHIYVHIEGNLYLYFYVSQTVRTPEDDKY